MAILLTGGQGTTTAPLAKLCLAAKVPFLIASRKGPFTTEEGGKAVKFDWDDASTFAGVFEHKFEGGEKIDTLWLIAPVSNNVVNVVGPFIKLAREKGVKKIVFLTGSSCERGGWGPGKLWDFLVEGKGEGDVVVCLRATWFIDNFLNWQHGATIKNENAIYTACGDGKIPFISANDIAKMAFQILTKDGPWKGKYRVLGREHLTFDQVAQTFTQTLGREIKHIKVSQEECAERYIKFGWPAHVGEVMAGIEVGTARGSEVFGGDDFEAVTGGKPASLGSWVEENKGNF